MKRKLLTLIAFIAAASMAFTACDAAGYGDFDETVRVYGDLGVDMDELIEFPAIEVLQLADGLRLEADSWLENTLYKILMDFIKFDVYMEISTISAMVHTGGETFEFMSETGTTAWLSGMALDDGYEAVYYRDGMFYVNDNGETAKFETDFNEMLDELESLQQGFDFYEGYELANFELTDDGLVLSFEIGGGFMNETLEQLSGTMFGELMGMDDIDYAENVSLNGIALTVLIGFDGNLRAMIIELSFTITLAELGGSPISGEMTIFTEYVQIGGVEITFPEDLESYELVR
jgi:hypothetical protein